MYTSSLLSTWFGLHSWRKNGVFILHILTFLVKQYSYICIHVGETWRATSVYAKCHFRSKEECWHCEVTTILHFYWFAHEVLRVFSRIGQPDMMKARFAHANSRLIMRVQGAKINTNQHNVRGARARPGPIWLSNSKHKTSSIFHVWYDIRFNCSLQSANKDFNQSGTHAIF
jgi:hypothetical protein